MDDFAAHTASVIADIDTTEVPGDVNFIVEQQINNGDERVGHYHLVIADGTATVVDGAASSPDITLRQDEVTARGLQDGTLHAQSAFLTGRLLIDGDINKLLEHGPLLGRLLGGTAS